MRPQKRRYYAKPVFFFGGNARSSARGDGGKSLQIPGTVSRKLIKGLSRERRRRAQTAWRTRKANRRPAAATRRQLPCQPRSASAARRTASAAGEPKLLWDAWGGSGTLGAARVIVQEMNRRFCPRRILSAPVAEPPPGIRSPFGRAAVLPSKPARVQLRVRDRFDLTPGVPNASRRRWFSKNLRHDCALR
jgi:hypothetical protein